MNSISNKIQNTFTKPSTWQVIILSFFFLLYLITGVTNHYLFRSYACDYGVYNFAFWDYAHFRISPCLIFHIKDLKVNFLQDHFSLTLFFLIPFYWLLNWLTGTYTLLILQTTAIILSGWILSKYITLKSNNSWVGVGAMLYYFLMQARYASMASDCNLAIFSNCLIPFFLYYFEKKKYLISGIIFLIALVSREDMPLVFIFIFLTLIIIHWKEKERIIFCSLLIVFSVSYFIILFSLIIPSLEEPGKHYSLFTYSTLGKTPFEALKFIFAHPLKTFNLLFHNQLNNPEYDGVKTEFYITYLISGGFILILKPQYIIWFIPIIAQKMFDDLPARWSIYGYYAIPVATMLPISAFLIIGSIKKTYFKYATTVLFCLLAWFATDRSFNREARALPWTWPLKENIFDASFFDSKLNINKVYKSLELIPENAKVSASNFYVPHLSQRRYIYMFPDVRDSEYIVVHQLWDNFMSSEKLYLSSIQNYLHDPKWIVVANDFPFLLLKKK
ncbi:MAG TPA: DUF2079 domain-containing protein [Bacteroidia bacterium]|nr:DUF2079 domain-containing protein [Bacteroidia bacterium]